MKNVKIHFTWFRVILIIVLMLGISFRFINIDKKVYWHDEVYTSVRISGYHGDDLLELFNGEILTPEDVLAFQRPRPGKDWNDVFIALSRHPEHPPLYYILARWWIQIFGASVGTIRSLSVGLSLFIFPGFYWLCWELFRSPKIGWMTILLVAISPFYVLYAQEAREYSLLSVVTLLSSAALLRAIHRQKIGIPFIHNLKNWSLYTLTLTLCFYTSLLSAAVAIAHGIYVILLERFRWTRCFSSFLISGIIGTLLYIPWMLAIVNNYAKMQGQTAWMKGAKPLIELISRWELHFSSIFIDIHPNLNSWLIARIAIFLFFALGYSVYCLYRHSPPKVGLFIITLIVIPALALMLPDLILGGQRSINSRYFVPSYIGVHISVAYLLCHPQFIKDKLKPIVLPLILTSGIISCLISSQADVWWNKSASYFNAEVAQIINQGNHPLVVSDTNGINLGNIISLSHNLDSNVRLQLVVKSQIPDIPSEFSEVFLYNPSQPLLSAVEDQYPIVTNPIKNYKSLLYEFKE